MPALDVLAYAKLNLSLDVLLAAWAASLRSPQDVGKRAGLAARDGVASLAAGCGKARGTCRVGGVASLAAGCGKARRTCRVGGIASLAAGCGKARGTCRVGRRRAARRKVRGTMRRRFSLWRNRRPQSQTRPIPSVAEGWGAFLLAKSAALLSKRANPWRARRDGLCAGRAAKRFAQAVPIRRGRSRVSKRAGASPAPAGAGKEMKNAAFFHCGPSRRPSVFAGSRARRMYKSG